MTGLRCVRRWFLVLAAVAALIVPAAAAGDGGSGGGGGGGGTPPPPTVGATFQPLGLLPGTIQSFGEGVSSDGKVVVGFATGANGVDHAFRWTAATGLQELTGAGVLAADAYAANSDGSVIVGTAWDGSGFGHHAFRWTPTGGMQLLPIADGLDEAADGSVVVGGGVWTQAGGIQPPLGSLGGGGAYSEGVSPDGGSIVGWSPTSSGFLHAFKWTSATGMTDLGVTDGTESVAQDVSSSGSVVVGQARDANGFWRAFRWTPADGMLDVGTLGGPMSVAYKATDDGTAAVGTSLTTGSSVSNHAFRWSTTRGMEDLQSALVNAGATGLTGWILYSANGISADGTVIVGTALDPSRNWVAWRATLPR